MCARDQGKRERLRRISHKTLCSGNGKHCDQKKPRVWEDAFAKKTSDVTGIGGRATLC